MDLLQLLMEPAAFEDMGHTNIDLILKVIYEIDLVKESIVIRMDWRRRAFLCKP